MLIYMLLFKNNRLWKKKNIRWKNDWNIKIWIFRLPPKLQDELIENIKLDKGIAKNNALKDNFFFLFVILNNKIPVFICGKAGCSKSLSFYLLFKLMKGEYSEKELFKKYTSLYVTSYQSSLTSTSEEIKKIFNNIKNIYKKSKNIGLENKSPKNLSLILFD